jgi:plasmid stabilization system protein ParE
MVTTTSKNLRIVWSKRARKQWDKILEFYITRNQSSAYSLKLNGRFYELLDLLCVEEFTSGELTSQRSIRRISFEEHFAVFFRVKRDCIEVTAIVDARRDIRLN